MDVAVHLASIVHRRIAPPPVARAQDQPPASAPLSADSARVYRSILRSSYQADAAGRQAAHNGGARAQSRVTELAAIAGLDSTAALMLHIYP